MEAGRFGKFVFDRLPPHTSVVVVVVAPPPLDFDVEP